MLRRTAELVASGAAARRGRSTTVQATSSIEPALAASTAATRPAPFTSDAPPARAHRGGRRRAPALDRRRVHAARGSGPRSRCWRAARTFGRLVLDPRPLGRRVDRGAHRGGRAGRPARRRARGRRVRQPDEPQSSPRARTPRSPRPVRAATLPNAFTSAARRVHPPRRARRCRTRTTRTWCTRR